MQHNKKKRETHRFTLRDETAPHGRRMQSWPAEDLEAGAVTARAASAEKGFVCLRCVIEASEWIVCPIADLFMAMDKRAQGHTFTCSSCA